MDQKKSEKIANQDEIFEFLTRIIRGETTEQIPIGKGYFNLEDNPSLKGCSIFIKQRESRAIFQ